MGRVQPQAGLPAGRGPVGVRAARVVLRRAPSDPHGFVVRTATPFHRRPRLGRRRTRQVGMEAGQPQPCSHGAWFQSLATTLPRV